ncbi:MAG: thermonuclease family protein [Nitriliruptoraceae bacterium]
MAVLESTDAGSVRSAGGEGTGQADAVAESGGQSSGAEGWTVVEVIDGDTIGVERSDGVRERVRLIGIDTPERGECGYQRASAAMAAYVDGATVELVAGARDDRDAYDRLLRYVDVDGVDVELELIEAGLAVARYDSRDGYGRHDREDAYVAADARYEHVCLTGR